MLFLLFFCPFPLFLYLLLNKWSLICNYSRLHSPSLHRQYHSITKFGPNKLNLDLIGFSKTIVICPQQKTNTLSVNTCNLMYIIFNNKNLEGHDKIVQI